MWKIYHQLVPNDLNVRFHPPSRLCLQAIIPDLRRTCSSSSFQLIEGYGPFGHMSLKVLGLVLFVLPVG